jgi:hypothetical protein
MVLLSSWWKLVLVVIGGAVVIAGVIAWFAARDAISPRIFYIE